MPFSLGSLNSSARSMPITKVDSTEMTANATFQVKILRNPERIVSSVSRVEKFFQPTFSFHPCG